MRFGKIENNTLPKLLKIIFAGLISCNCAYSVACQSKEQRVTSALQQCQELLDKDNLSSALKCYMEAGAAYPGAVDRIVETGDKAVFKKCVEYKNKKDIKNALLCFETAAGLLPDKANVHFQLADSYFQYAEQEQKITKFYDKNLLDRAEAAVKKGLQIAPEDAPAHALYGDILGKKRDWQAAVREYETTVKLKPDADFYWLFLAIAQEKAEKTEEAIESYKRVLTLAPGKTIALYYLGKLYEKTGNTNKAIESFEKLLKIDSDYDDAKQRLENLEKQKTKPKQKVKLQGATNDAIHLSSY